MTATATPAPKKAREVFGPDGIYEMDQRMMAALARRAARGDLDALTALDRLKADIDRVMAEIAVPGLRSEDGGAYSWNEIGQALGYPEKNARQSAYERFKHADKSRAARRPGAQPANLR